jgi:GDP/UDP-N,N'-diacetylbacillosamine 2-epimerase (hydrolysing)
MQGVIDADVQALCLMPNADAGSTYIRDVLAEFQLHPDVRLATHLRRSDFVSWMGAADVMVGNSSSGIIEAASLGLPVINVGDRQAERERSGNVIDAPSDAKVIKSAVREALNAPRREWINVYGDGAAGDRIVDLLTSLPLTPQLLMKTNAY